MNHYIKSICLLSIALLFLAAGCEKDTDISAAGNASVNSQKDEFNALQNKYNVLSKEHFKLLKANEELSKVNYHLEIYAKNFNSWTKMLVKGYGPSIWYFGENELLPYFHHHPKSDNVQDVLGELNMLFISDGFPEIILKDINSNVAYMRVNDASLCSAGMGLTGTRAYITVVQYTLTSLDYIAEVKIDGDDYNGPCV